MAESLGSHTPYTGFTPVPQTPGTRVKEGALPRLLNLLSPVVHSWGLFALQIGVPNVQISQIHAANPPTNPKSLYTSLTQALEWWINNHDNPTYEVIISVLDPKLDETTPVMNRALASQVRGFMAKEQSTAPLPAATSAYIGPTGQQGSTLLDDYTKRNLIIIKEKFMKLQQNACKVLQVKLSKKEIKEKLHLFLTTIIPRESSQCLPKSSDLKKIFEAMTRNDLWNHHNYFPLESLIEEFGCGTDLLPQVEQFKMDRSSFQIATKIKDYIPAAKSLLAESDEPVESAPTKRDRKYLWKLGVKLDERVADESLEYLDELWRSLAKTLLLPPVSLVLHAIVEKSILVVWLIPAKLGPKAIEIARQSAEFFRSYPILSVTIGDECVYEKEIEGEKKLLQSSSFAHEMQVPRSPSVDKSEEVDTSGNGIPGGPSSQPPQTPSKALPFETPPVSPTGAQTQPTSKHEAQEPFAATAEIEISDLEFGNQIREGGTGIVYKGHWKSRGLDVAIKTTGALEKTEVEHLNSLDHPNIVLFHGAVIKKPNYYIVMEFAEHGSLHDYLHEVKFQVDYKQRLKWAMQIAKGMNYLHMMKIMHRDLKPHNVLITKDLTAKICDFGAAKTFEHTTAQTMTGTFRWIAPEVLNEEPYSLQCDVFSFGMMLYELIVCKEPFSNIPTMEAVAKIRNGENPDIPEWCETFLSNLLTMCWKKDPKARPTFARVMAILDSKGFHKLSKIFLQSLQKMVDSMDETSNAAKKTKSVLSSLTLQLRDGKTVPLVDPAAYQEARTIPELMKSMSPYWNCLSLSIFEAVVKSSGCSASTSALQDFKSARNSSSHLILVAQAATASGDQKALHPLKHHSEKLQSCQPAVFARLPGHQLCASVNVTQISVEVDKAVLHLTDYNHVTEAVVAFLNLPVAALVYCGCSENPLALFWEVSRELVGHISSVIPGFRQYRQLLEYNITTLCVRDELKYSCPNMKDVEYWAASSAGHADKILDLLKCVTVDVVDFAGWTALVYASWNGHSQAAKALIAEGANVNHQIKEGATPLIVASQNGHRETVQLLLSRGANINLQAKDGGTPLMIASHEGHRETVQLLLSRGANINLQSKNGATPLFAASQKGHSSLVELLLGQGADINLPMKDGHTPLIFASTNGHTDVAELLLNNGAKVNLQAENGATPLFAASQKGHSSLVELLLGQGADINLQMKNGFTPLSVASQNGHSETVQLLLSRGANVNLQEKTGATPLYIASEKGHSETVQLLLSRGANINLQEEDGVTPLFIASQNGHSETVQLLLSRGANINLPRKDGNTPLIMASLNGHSETVELLIRSDADINTLGWNQETAVMKAARKGHVGVVTRLLQHRANIKITNKERETALDIATRAGHTKVCEELRKYY